MFFDNLLNKTNLLYSSQLSTLNSFTDIKSTLTCTARALKNHLTVFILGSGTVVTVAELPLRPMFSTRATAAILEMKLEPP